VPCIEARGSVAIAAAAIGAVHRAARSGDAWRLPKPPACARVKAFLLDAQRRFKPGTLDAD
jgi:hypothetical protein